MSIEDQIAAIKPGENMTDAERAEIKRQRAAVRCILGQIAVRGRRARAWAEAREGIEWDRGMEWDQMPLWDQYDTLLGWFPVYVIQQMSGDTEAVMLEEAGSNFCARRDGHQAAPRLAAGRGARAAERGTRLLRRLMGE